MKEIEEETIYLFSFLCLIFLFSSDRHWSSQVD